MITVTRKVQLAISTATRLHWNQRRKALSEPYIVHPYTVGFITGRYTQEEEIICAAFLHDVLEDVPPSIYSRQQMLSEFGSRVTDIVQAVSEDKLSEKNSRENWEVRKQSYLKNLHNSTDEGAMLVAAADKIHNLQSMTEAYRQKGETMWRAFTAPDHRKLWFYSEVLKVLKGKTTSPIVREYEQVLLTTTQALKLDLA
ncbi:MAG: HD domain-containing protein [Patescibacteria group bacterium]